MKKIVILLILVVLIGTPLLAVDYTSYQQGFQDFAYGVANALPFNSSIGLNWSDAYIGQFPHFGVGVTVGATTIPYDAVSAVAAMLGKDLANELGIPELVTWGVPLPAYTVEARLGGFVFPFDMGVKVGYLPDEVKMFLPANLSANYLLAGADVRFSLVKEKGFLPDISIGGGYNYMNGGVTVKGILSDTQTIASVAGNDITLSNPNLNFNWQANVIDLKAQASKKLLFITFSLGTGASYAISSAGGGLEADVLYGGVPITSTDIQNIIDYYTVPGQEPPDVSATGFLVSSKANGWGFRAFGGLSFNLFILKLDLNAMYNFTSGSLGASVNARIQL